MKLIFALLLAAVALTVAIEPDRPVYRMEDAPKLFELFMKKYNRKYNDAHDREVHRKAFEANLRSIIKNNVRDRGTPAIHIINKFADETREERRATMKRIKKYHEM